MERIGELIATKRKEKGLTQGQFADQLNITHQAVSKWERGEAMPEISKLVEIGRILDISLDQILSPETCEETVREGIRQIEDALAADGETQSAQEKAHTQDDGGCAEERTPADERFYAHREEISIGELIALAPEMSQKALLDACQQMRRINGIYGIRMLLEFLSVESADELGMTGYQYGGFDEIKYLCQYMSSDVLDAMAQRSLKTYGWGYILPALPYLSKKKLEAMAMDSYYLYGISSIRPAVAYLDPALVEKLADQEVEQVGNWGTIDAVIPQLPTESVVRLAIKFYNHNDISAFNGRFQLIGPVVTARLVDAYMAKNGFIREGWTWCGYILPFAQKELLENSILEGYRRLGLDSVYEVYNKHLSKHVRDTLVRLDNKYGWKHVAALLAAGDPAMDLRTKLLQAEDAHAALPAAFDPAAQEESPGPAQEEDDEQFFAVEPLSDDDEEELEEDEELEELSEELEQTRSELEQKRSALAQCRERAAQLKTGALELQTQYRCASSEVARRELAQRYDEAVQELLGCKKELVELKEEIAELKQEEQELCEEVSEHTD